MDDSNELRKDIASTVAQLIIAEAETAGHHLIKAARTAKMKIQAETSSEMKMEWVQTFLERFRSIIDEYHQGIEPHIQEGNEAVFELRLHGEE